MCIRIALLVGQTFVQYKQGILICISVMWFVSMWLFILVMCLVVYPHSLQVLIPPSLKHLVLIISSNCCNISAWPSKKMISLHIFQKVFVSYLFISIYSFRELIMHWQYFYDFLSYAYLKQPRSYWTFHKCRSCSQENPHDLLVYDLTLDLS